MLLRRQHQDIVFYTSPLLEQARIPHAFSTRVCGVSPAPFASLNLGISRDSTLKDTSENVEENYRRFATTLGPASRQRCWISQVHQADICTIHPGDVFTSGPRADALMTDDPTRLLGIKYADCVPILLATNDGKVVAAIHAGWRGIVAGILPLAVQRMTQISRSRPNTFIAAVGPCICLDHFEVGPEVSAEFIRHFGPSAPIRPANAEHPKDHIDLARAVAMQLTQAGLSTGQINLANLCTFSNPEDFYSHRRDGAATGRMAALIAPSKTR